MATASTEIKVTPEIAAEHGLTADEYARIQKILGRDPNITELGIFSVMWSEHCSYKSSNVHLKRLPTRGRRCCRVPAKMPAWWTSATAWPPPSRWNRTITRATSSRFRARPPASAAFCAIFSRWARGRSPCSIRCASGHHGGRQCGCATMLSVLRPRPDDVFRPGNNRRQPPPARWRGARHRLSTAIVSVCRPSAAKWPSSRATRKSAGERLALGIAKKEELFLANARGEGNPVIYVGAKTGRDGIHGASLLASAEFTEESQQKRPNVQVGDPFLEKLLLEACLEAMATGAIVGIQDMGAAGLTSSTCEMASRGGDGHRDRSRNACRSARPA